MHCPGIIFLNSIAESGIWSTHPRQPYSISSLEINRVSATRNATFWMFFRVLDSSWQAVSNIGHLEPDNCPSTENALGRNAIPRVSLH